MRPFQRGNILFLILLAVVLFAALAYAITQSMRGGGKDGSSERADLLAAQLIQNAGLVEQTMMRAMMVDGVKEWAFDLSGVASRAAPNATCTSSLCRIYTSRGGGVPDFQLPEWASTTPTDTGNRSPIFYVASILDVGTAAPDLILRYDNLTRPVCDAINNRLGYTDIDQTVSDTINNGSTASDFSYSGNLSAMPAGTNTGIGDANAKLKGRTSFCYAATPATYYFLHVLMVR